MTLAGTNLGLSEGGAKSSCGSLKQGCVPEDVGCLVFKSTFHRFLKEVNKM